MRVEADDPAFALVTGSQLQKQIRASISDFESAVGKVEERTGRVIAERVKESPV